MKHESDESGIIVYDMHNEASLGRSPASKKTKDKEEKKEAFDTDLKPVDDKSMALLGGFSGRVYDKLTYRTIQGALVTVAKDLSIKTDEKGIFVVTGIKPGKYRITVFEEGYMVQSCKSTATAGETTNLNSFHLIPDCLVAEYPDDIVKEEEETTEEEFVEFAMEATQSILSEEVTNAPESEDARKKEGKAKAAVPAELSEQTAQMSSGTVAVTDIRGKTSPDLEIHEDITKRKTIERLKRQTVTKDFTPPRDTGSKVFPTLEDITEVSMDEYVDIIAATVEKKKEVPPDEFIAVLLEQIETTTAGDAAEAARLSLEERTALTEEPFIPEISFAPAETVIAEAEQPEEPPENIQEKIPWEITIEETLVETMAEVTAYERTGEVAYQEESAEQPLTGEAIEEITPFPEQLEQPLVPSSDVAPETAVDKVVQPGETPQAPAGEKSRLGQLWKSLRKKISKELELSREQPAEPIMGGVVEEITPSPEQQKQPLVPPTETTSETTTREMTSEKPYKETPPDTTPFEEIQVSIASTESTETAISVPAGKVVENISSIDEPSRMSLESGVTKTTQLEEVQQELSGEEAPVEKTSAVITVVEITQKETKKDIPQEELLEPSVGVAPGITAHEVVLEEIPQEEPSIEVSLKEIPTLIVFVDSLEVIIPAPEKTTVGDISFIDQLPHILIETDITEITQAEETLPELAGMEPLVMITVEDMAQESIEEETHREQSLEPSVGVVPGITAQEETTEATHGKESLEPCMDVALEITTQEEIAEVTQPEEAPQELSGEKSVSKLIWWTRRKRKTKGYQEQPPRQSMGDSSQITPRGEVLREIEREESSVDVFADKKVVSIPAETTQTPMVAVDLTDAVIIKSEEVIEDISSADGLTRMPIETGTRPEEVPQDPPAKKAPVKKVPIETAAEKPVQEETKVEIQHEKPPVSISVEETLESISDNDLASVSPEEREAMSRGYDSAEVEGFIGIINAQPNPAYKGLPISIAYTLRNVACDNPDDFTLQIIVKNPDTGIIHDTLETPVACSKNTFSMGGFVIFTTTYETHVYRLNMQIISKKAKASHLLIDIPLEIKAIF